MVRNLTALSAIALASLMSFGASSAFASGDAATGAKLFKRCTICHTAARAGANRIGPNLFGVVGRKAGSLAGYSYSPAMQSSGVVWSETALTKFLMSPAAVIHGTKMTFSGFPEQQEAEAVAAYLATLK